MPAGSATTVATETTGSFLEGRVLMSPSYRSKLPSAEIMNALIVGACQGPEKKSEESALISPMDDVRSVSVARLVSPVILESDPWQHQDKVVVLSRWEGVVTELVDDGFVARLSELSGEESDHDAEIPMEEVSLGDRKLVVPGAVFYWSLGYRDDLSGQRKRESAIRFRRLPRSDEQTIALAKGKAEALREKFGWTTSDNLTSPE